jgi:hypothetical protein
MPHNPLWLDLGSGPTPAPDFLGVDLGGDGDGVVHVDLWNGHRWPFESNSIERLRAWHVIEHIPHDRVPLEMTEAKVLRRSNGVETRSVVPFRRTQDAFFWFFDEAFRIAKSGCTFELAWPHPWHEHAVQDPTHCRSVSVATLHYLSREGRRSLRVHHYPVSCDWHIVPGSVTVLGSDESLLPYDSHEVAARHVGAFHEIRATLIKP